MRENNSLANVERFNAMQKWDYKRKVAHAQEMAEAFYSWAREHGKNVHLSVGGLDSITLHYFLESIGLPVTCISCSCHAVSHELMPHKIHIFIVDLVGEHPHTAVHSSSTSSTVIFLAGSWKRSK